MIEFLSTNLFWWHWVILGISLLTMEIFTGTFMLLGLGASAIIIGIIERIYPISIESQLTIWMILSIISLAIWFKYMKDTSIENSGQSNHTLETLGTVEKKIDQNSRGRVRFDSPLLGNTLWQATAKESIEVGSRVKIVEIKGQLIEVAKIEKD